VDDYNILVTGSADYSAVNVGTGCATSVREIARLLSRRWGKEIEPEIVAKYREGVIRHCISNISRTRTLLDYSPHVSLEAGVSELLSWVGRQSAEDKINQTTVELENRQLFH
jgi:dTDP-L-rhamnose 4-epimerase